MLHLTSSSETSQKPDYFSGYSPTSMAFFNCSVWVRVALAAVRWADVAASTASDTLFKSDSRPVSRAEKLIKKHQCYRISHKTISLCPRTLHASKIILYTTTYYHSSILYYYITSWQMRESRHKTVVVHQVNF